MPYPQGAVVVATDIFGNNPSRPYVILSNSTLPFLGQEYVTAAVTTTSRPPAVELTSDRIEKGGLPRTSYISPWTVVTLKDSMISRQPAKVTDATVDTVWNELNGYLQT